MGTRIVNKIMCRSWGIFGTGVLGLGLGLDKYIHVNKEKVISWGH